MAKNVVVCAENGVEWAAWEGGEGGVWREKWTYAILRLFGVDSSSEQTRFLRGETAREV